MKVIAINGSHRQGKNTATMLMLVLEEIEGGGGKTELLELPDFRISVCRACNSCLRKPECSIQDDDMSFLAEKMMAADAIIIGSPVYFANVTSLLKIFMDRTRCQEITQIILERFLQAHGLQVVESRDPQSGIYNLGPLGTMFESMEDEKVRWKKGVLEDTLTVKMCRNLGKNILQRLKERESEN